VVSWLAVLHIRDRLRLCAWLRQALRVGGACYIEDLCMRAPFAKDYLRDLREIIFGITVTNIDDYVADLRSAGFVDIVTTDLTSDWATYATIRLAAWRENRVSYAAMHGEGAYVALDMFY
jgi:hypothetical protein